MADVQELNINNTTYDIKAKTIVDQNDVTSPVKTWTGTQSEYLELGTYFAYTYGNNTVYLRTLTPELTSTVYTAIDTESSLTITAINGNTITLSDTNIYTRVAISDVVDTTAYDTSTIYTTTDNTNPLVSDVYSLDNKSLVKNASNEIEVAGVINNNGNTALVKTWTGTKAEYDALLANNLIENDVLYNITDDSTALTFDAYTKTETDTLLVNMLNALYPVGSIYIGTTVDCPLALMNIGTWQLVASDRVLQGAGTKGIVKTELPQNVKLPNITGTFSPWAEGNRTATGAFYVAANNQPGNNQSGDNDNTLFGFDASRSSPIYSGDGTDTEIQQPAYLVNIWERIPDTVNDDDNTSSEGISGNESSNIEGSGTSGNEGNTGGASDLGPSIGEDSGDDPFGDDLN